MRFPIDHPARLGQIVRAARKAQGLRQDDAAGSIGVSENFLGKLESGSGSLQWGKLLQVLQGLGLQLAVDVPDDIAARLPSPPGSERGAAS